MNFLGLRRREASMHFGKQGGWLIIFRSQEAGCFCPAHYASGLFHPCLFFPLAPVSAKSKVCFMKQPTPYILFVNRCLLVVWSSVLFLLWIPLFFTLIYTNFDVVFLNSIIPELCSSIFMKTTQTTPFIFHYPWLIHGLSMVYPMANSRQIRSAVAQQRLALREYKEVTTGPSKADEFFLRWNWFQFWNQLNAEI